LIKMIDQLYQYRSKMVHGNRQIRSAFSNDGVNANEKRRNEEHCSEHFAIGILTLLLQHLIAKRQSSFRFKTILDNPES
jgi:hypothetical protein